MIIYKQELEIDYSPSSRAVTHIAELNIPIPIIVSAAILTV